MKNLKEIAKEVLEEENKGISTKEFRTCKLVSVETKYGVTNGTPIMVLMYQFDDTGEIGEDNYCFTENSQKTVIQRLNRAYLGFTGNGLKADDFDSTSHLKSKFNEIVGKESLVKEYRNSQGFINYQHYNPNEDRQEKNNYGFWGEIENAEEDNVNGIIYPNTTEIDLNITPKDNTITAVNLQEELEVK